MFQFHAPTAARRCRSSTARVLLALPFLGGGLALGTGAALAAGHATVAMGRQGRQMKIAWRDARNARFSMPGTHGNSYTLLHNGKIYIVANGRVMPGNMFAGMMRGRGRGARNSPTGQPHLIGPKGTEKTAGITGKRYLIHWNAAHVSPTMQDKPVVLSHDRRVRELWQVWSAYAHAMGARYAGTNPAANAAAMTRLFKGRGLLRMGHDFRVVKIDGRAPSASALALPAHASSSNPAMKMLGRTFGH